MTIYLNEMVWYSCCDNYVDAFNAMIRMAHEHISLNEDEVIDSFIDDDNYIIVYWDHSIDVFHVGE